MIIIVRLNEIFWAKQLPQRWLWRVVRADGSHARETMHESAALTDLPRLTHSQESGPGESSEPGAGLQSVWRHQQRETLRHLRLQRLQRVLQTQREEEAHLQVRTQERCMVGNRGTQCCSLTVLIVGQQVPGRYRHVSGGQSPSEPVSGVSVEEVPAGGHEQGRWVGRITAQRSKVMPEAV